jgi:hypothetical protein
VEQKEETMKRIAKTIIDMTTSETMTRLLDRSRSIDEALLEELSNHWRFDLYSRRPGPALVDAGILKPTDLDLACFLSALVERGAVLNLPTYKSQRPKTVREDEWIVSSKNRHGKAIGLVSNKEVFSFGLRIVDQNVVRTTETGDEVGAPRTFMLVGLDGEWSESWRKIEFVPTAKENDFLHDKKLWTDNVVVFENFVHPNRWTSFYGKYYFLSKVVIERLEDENSHVRSEIKRLLAAGFEWPSSGEPGAPKEWAKSSTEKGVSRKFETMQVEVDVPWSGWFPELGCPEGSHAGSECHVGNPLVVASERLRRGGKILSELRLATRATEFAFFKAGHAAKGFPSWIAGAKWTSGYVQKGKRTAWKRLVLNQTFPGEMGFALRYRTFEKSEIVAAG